MDYESFLELIKKRRSIREFKEDPVKDDDIKKIVDTVRYAPSGMNTQPWEVLVVRKPELKDSIAGFIQEAMKEMMKNMPPRPDGQKFQPPMGYTKAPVFILLFNDNRTRNFMPPMDDERWKNLTYSNLALGFHNILLAATTLGLVAQWVSAVGSPIVNNKVKELFKLPDSFQLYAMAAMGYPNMEPTPKKMREISDMVHYDECGPDDFRTDDDVKAFFAP